MHRTMETDGTRTMFYVCVKWDGVQIYSNVLIFSWVNSGMLPNKLIMVDTNM
jgi:hypothetical protein